MRLNPDGSLDPASAPAGSCACPSTCTPPGPTTSRSTGQGRIVMAGVRLRGGDAQDSATVCVIRLLGDGRPDPGFSGDGVALVDHGYGNDSAEAVLLRGGKVIVAGEGRVASGSSRFGIARLRSDGRLDRSFGRRGHRWSPSALAGWLGLRARGRAARATGGRGQRRDRGPRTAVRARPHRPRRPRASAAPAARRARSAATPSAVRVTRGGILVGAARSPRRDRPLRLGPRPLHHGRPAARRRPDRLRDRGGPGLAMALTPGHATLAASIYAPRPRPLLHALTRDTSGARSRGATK